MSELGLTRGLSGQALRTSPLSHPTLLYLAGVFFLTLQDATAKWLTQHYPVNEIVFFRAFVSLVVIACFIGATGNISALRTHRFGAHVVRGVLIAVTIFLYILGLSHLQLATAVSLSYSAPLFLTVLSVPLLGERVTSARWIAVIFGFVGALIILQPTASGFDAAGLYILASALTYALAIIATRRLTRTETMLSTLTYGFLTTAVLSALTLPVAFVTPTWEHLPILLALGLGGVVSTSLFVLALSSAEVSAVAPLDFTGLVWGTLIGFLLWRDVPTLSVCLGAGVIVSVGLYMYRTTDRPRTRRTGKCA